MGLHLHWNIFLYLLLLFLLLFLLQGRIRATSEDIQARNVTKVCFHIGMMSTLLKACYRIYTQYEGGNILDVPSRGMSTFYFFSSMENEQIKATISILTWDGIEVRQGGTKIRLRSINSLPCYLLSSSSSSFFCVCLASQVQQKANRAAHAIGATIMYMCRVIGKPEATREKDNSSEKNFQECPESWNVVVGARQRKRRHTRKR